MVLCVAVAAPVAVADHSAAAEQSAPVVLCVAVAAQASAADQASAELFAPELGLDAAVVVRIARAAPSAVFPYQGSRVNAQFDPGARVYLLAELELRSEQVVSAAPVPAMVAALAAAGDLGVLLSDQEIESALAAHLGWPAGQRVRRVASRRQSASICCPHYSGSASPGHDH